MHIVHRREKTRASVASDASLSCAAPSARRWSMPPNGKSKQPTSVSVMPMLLRDAGAVLHASGVPEAWGTRRTTGGGRGQFSLWGDGKASHSDRLI